MKTSEYPKITLITPSFNQGHFIRETIDSILSQDYPNLEYIVVDGGSTDETVSILKSYGEKITWVSEKDLGQANAINKGLRRASGEILGYINSDDLLLPGVLTKIATKFQNNLDLNWISGDYFIINEKGKKIQSFTVWYKRVLRFFPYFFTLGIANFVIQPSTFWRKEVIEKIGYFDESLQYCMDYDFWLRCIKHYPLGILSEPCSLFRIHKSSKGGSQYKKQFLEEHSVIQRHTTNPVILLLHKLHASAIVGAYNLIK